jgi:putative endopeptidase
MHLRRTIAGWTLALAVSTGVLTAAEGTPKVPRFSVDNMDRTADLSVDFFRFAAGNWVKSNPVPADKSRWGGFDELQDRNWFLLREILGSAAKDAGPSAAATGPRRQVGDFFASVMDTNRLEQLRFRPLAKDLKRIAAIRDTRQLFRVIAEGHLRSPGVAFGAGVSADAKDSSRYAFDLAQGGLGLPDRDYYLAEGFAPQRDAYRAFLVRLLKQVGVTDAAAEHQAATVLSFETELAKASKTRVERRDPNANYNRLTLPELAALTPGVPWDAYFSAIGAPKLPYVVVGQTHFFATLAGMLKTRPLDDWKTYLRAHLVKDSAPHLHAEAEREHFAFYGTTLRGQPRPEPRWQRAAKVVDGNIGEALGQLYVEKHFPPASKAKMAELIGNLRAVFKDRLGKLAWMSPATRTRALVKFDRFTQKIGHPDRFRDYSKVKVRRDDLLGNIWRASKAESRRELARVGKAVDRSEWAMTPQTVNAYFNPTQNEIVFPAGILQPPFFDAEADDAVNYGAIGVVIGHEITHGYDDQGRQFDADGNLKDWWTADDAKEFDARAQKVVDQYGAYEALPGLKVNGRLTLGENIADLGGTSVAYEALQRSLAKDPSKRKSIDGFTPEQRFFLSLAQLWRVNWREAELRRRIVTDPHSPSQFRAIGPHVNMAEFFDAFGIKEGAPMWRPPALRSDIW